MPRNPSVYTQYIAALRGSRSLVGALSNVWNWQIRHRSGPTWQKARYFPWYLERLVQCGLLRRGESLTYRVDTENTDLIEALYYVGAEMARADAAAREAWARQESLRRAEFDRQRTVRLAEEARQRAVEAERRRQVELQEQTRMEKGRIWSEGSPLEIGSAFGSGDEVISHLLSRGATRREIVSALHVGEHRVTRIRRGRFGQGSAATGST